MSMNSRLAIATEIDPVSKNKKRKEIKHKLLLYFIESEMHIFMYLSSQTKVSLTVDGMVFIICSFVFIVLLG